MSKLLPTSLAVVADTLVEIGAVKLGAFKLKKHEKHPDAPLSPYFFNLRTPENPKPGPLTPHHVDLCAAVMYNVLQTAGITYDQLAPVPNAADPMATALARLSGKPILWLVKEDLGEGKRRIAGIRADSVYEPGQSALTIDDLVTEADSKIEAIVVQRGAGLVVEHVLVLVDREQGGREQLAKIGVTLHAVFTVTQLMNYYLEKGTIGEKTYAVFQEYLAAERAALGLP